jgi:hypothetical protein
MPVAPVSDADNAELVLILHNMQNDMQNAAGELPVTQPFIGASSEFRAELQIKANNAALERSKIEAALSGITARVDDLYAVENACKCALEVLK